MSDSQANTLQTGVSVEQQILDASQDRAVLDCAEETITADDIRRACATDNAAGRDQYGIRIANAVVVGPLNLSAFRLGEPLHFEGCTFDEAAVFEGADLQDLVFTNCKLPGLLANGVRIRRDLVLSGSLVTGAHQTAASIGKRAAIWLAEAEVGGRLQATGTKILTKTDRPKTDEVETDRALFADRARFGGAVRLVGGFRADAELRLMGATVGGVFELAGANLKPRSGLALNLTESTLGSLFLVNDGDSSDDSRRDWLKVRGVIDLTRMTVHGRVLIRGADLRADPWLASSGHVNKEGGVIAAIKGPGATVDGEFRVGETAHIHGGVILSGSTLLGGIKLLGAHLGTKSQRIALDLSQSTISAGLWMSNCKVHGLLEIDEANIIGSINLFGTLFTEPNNGECISGFGLAASGDVNLMRVRTSGGGVRLRGAKIQGSVIAFEARLRNEGRIALDLYLAHVGGDVELSSDFSSIGRVSLDLAVVEGSLACVGGSFRSRPKDPTAILPIAEAEPKPRKSPGVIARLHFVVGELREVLVNMFVKRPATVDDHGEVTFSARSATFRGGLVLGWEVAGSIVFTDASSSSLTDRPLKDWPSGARIAGFTYERFTTQDFFPLGDRLAIGDRTRWLQRVAPDDPGPWEYAARVLRADGYNHDADQLLINQQRWARGRHGWVRKQWDMLLDGTVEYGYRPWRALRLLLYLIVFVTLWVTLNENLMRTSDESGMVYSPSGPIAGQSQTLVRPESLGGSCGGGQVRCFEPIVYAVDTVVPIIDLNQRTTWYVAETPEGRLLGGILYFCTVAGWFLSTVLVFSLAKRPDGQS